MKTKRKSSRQSPTIRRTIQIKSKATRKKIKKLKKLGAIPKKVHKKDIRIPNNFPHKAELVKRMEYQIIKENCIRMAQKRKNVKDAANEIEHKAEADNTLEIFAKNARIAQERFKAASENTLETMEKGVIERHHASSVSQVIDTADIIIQVLDARDPQGSRSLSLEEKVTRANKKLLFLINKIDLIPRENLFRWINILGHTAPVVAFLAIRPQCDSIIDFDETQAESKNFLGTNSKTIGIKATLEVLKRIAASLPHKVSTVVGVVGQPNTGKSSVINSLARNGFATRIGNEPGITKTLQEILLDKKMRLIDTPGVIMDYDGDLSRLIMRNAIRDYPEGYELYIIKSLIKLVPKQALMEFFKIPDFTDDIEFLDAIAFRTGKLLAGGMASKENTAKYVVQFLVSGRIIFYSEPEHTINSEGRAFVVPEFSPALNFDDILKLNMEELEELNHAANQNENYLIAPDTPMKDSSTQMGTTLRIIVDPNRQEKIALMNKGKVENSKKKLTRVEKLKLRNKIRAKLLAKNPKKLARLAAKSRRQNKTYMNASKELDHDMNE